VAFLPNGILTLLTDLGHNDPSVGILKGIALSRHVQARVIDLCHHVPAHDVVWASFVLAGSYKHFPPGTVHCAVVDPGSGTDRKVLVAETAGHVLVAPDNGVLTKVLGTGVHVYAVDLKRVPVAPIRWTWHTRDVLAPIAALLSSGKLTVENVGPVEESPRLLDLPSTEHTDKASRGVVVGEDRFGNLFTSLTESDLPDDSNPHEYEADIAGHRVPLVHSYNQVARGEMLALFNCYGLLEVAIRNGRAADELAWKRGVPITVQRLD